MHTRLFPVRFYYGALLLVIILFASTLYHRVVYFDDAWFAEQAFWLRRDGYVHSELFRGLNGWEKQLFVFHKAYIYLLAATTGLWGESLWAVKCTGLLLVGGGLLLLLRYFRGQAEAQGLAAMLFLGCGGIVTFGFTGRPEPLVMCCGLASYLTLAGPAPPVPGKWARAGAWAGLAALAHLNGLIYLVAGALWLFRGPGGWRRAGWFGLVGGGVASLYLADALLAHCLPVLVQQFVHDPVNQSKLTLAHKLEVMGEFCSMFVHSDAELPLTVVLLLTFLLMLGSRTRPGNFRLSPAGYYLLLLLGSFWLLTKSSTAYYVLLFVPFFIIVVVEYAVAVGPILPAWQRYALLLALSLYPLTSGLRARYLWHENTTYPQPEVENPRLAAHMPCRHAKVIAPIDFVFGQFNNYRIHGLTYYAFLSRSRPAGELPLPEFFRLAAADSVTYIIADYRTFNDAYRIPPEAAARIGAYQRVYQTRWYGLYARQSACP